MLKAKKLKLICLDTFFFALCVFICYKKLKTMIKKNQTLITEIVNDARNDYLVIQKLSKSEIVSVGAICLHAQKLAEKYLKAFLIYRGFDVTKEHDVESMLMLCTHIDQDFCKIDSKSLSNFGIKFIEEGAVHKPNIHEAMEYKDIAISIKELAESKIK